MILVTGATGLLGSRLLFDLAKAGAKVRALKRSSSDMRNVNRYFDNDPQLFSNIEWAEGDVTDLFSLADALKGIEKVYHCAARVSFHPSERPDMHNVNICGTANLVNLSLESGVKKICHVSSVAALGRTGSEEIINENAGWKTSSHNSSYAVSKYGAEREVWRGIAEGLDAVIVNPGVIIGPGNWKNDSSLLFGQVAKGLKFYTSGINGFVDVRDVSTAMIRLMEATIKNERFVVVSESIPFRDVFDTMADEITRKRAGIYAGPLLSSVAWRLEHMRYMLTGSKPVITRETARSASGKYYYDNSKIKSALNFDFIPVKKSIKDTAEIFKKEN
jgi:dihydroflavonol-4-reductase